MMRLEKRIRALEAKMFSDPAILYFADGSTKEICGRSDYMLDLLLAACRAEVSPAQAAHLDIIRESVSAREPGGGRMIELVRCALRGPAGERGDRRGSDG